MGLYIETEYKHDWLVENGTEITFSNKIEEDEIKVCLVDNGFFYAALVIYDKREFDYIVSNPDERDKRWFKVKKEITKPVCPEWNTYMNGDKDAS